MQHLLNNYKLMAVIAGFLTFLSVLAVINPVTGWFCFALLFSALREKSPKIYFNTGILFGAAIALPSYFWMIEGAQTFTGGNTIYGYLVFILSSCLLALYFGVLLYSCRRFMFKENSRAFIFINALIISAVFVTFEAALMMVSSYLPWFGFHSGNTLIDNIYTIQPAALFGIHGLTFVIIIVNYFLAVFFARKDWSMLMVPVAVIALYYAAGFMMYQALQKEPTGKPIKVAILNANIPAEMKWDDNNGNQLVAGLLDLNQKAAALQPDIALWNESAIPWTYRPDDDLVNEILRLSAPAHMTHILGINSDYADDVVYNSVYALLPDGKIAGRYDKRILLAFIEQPLQGLIFPFLSSGGFVVKPGENNAPLETPYGKAGILICNESAVPSAAADMVKNGAAFLFNLSNDGWFSNTYIADLHFYNVRMRAVETRKDIAYNSNRGFSGLVKASGEIDFNQRSTEPFVQLVELSPNTQSTLAANMPSLLVYVCAIVLLGVGSFRMIRRSAHGSLVQ